MRPSRPTVKAKLDLHPRADPYHAILWWQERVERPRFVYFIQDSDDGPVKIGEAFNPKARLGELQCGNPRELHLRAVVLATDSTEATLHSRFGAFCIHGEWFLHTETLLSRACTVQREQVELWNRRANGYEVAQLAERFISPSVPH